MSNIQYKVRHFTNEKNEEILDEIFLMVDNKCVLHLEMMDYDHIWMALDTDNGQPHFNFMVNKQKKLDITFEPEP